ncbi:ligase-associated DNA damage response exonuclease [Candidatus Protochlamydia phocaeensis]|uniref:ligase-associated DNA damage response exonuclease n=1 Tax=Candidatus Protochlamydia phocaeensis TaxID=1414722 RepID=UPI000838D021|nr:ligase-associated DNA damage response exonuclease [Candidatus Protochlamydia phocaeensis]
MVKQALIEFTSRGIYCPKGRFYIDPWKPVNKAVITHAHADHAYGGCRHYLAQKDSLPLLKYRLGLTDRQCYGIDYGERLLINGVKVSLHPAGHIIGSAQIRLEAQGEVWVVSGDYKLENDGLAPSFEPVPCDVFITESTFGLPCFQWEPQKAVFEEINAWCRFNRQQGITSILLGYALGKAQRLLNGLDPSIGPLYAHGAVWNMTEIIRQQSPLAFPPLQKVTVEIPKQALLGGIVLAPPSVAQSAWINRFHPCRTGYVSGWMSLRGIRRRRGADRGFALSDHADWPALQQAIQATGAKRIIVTHGFTSAFARWLTEQGYEAQEAFTIYGEGEGDQED